MLSRFGERLQEIYLDNEKGNQTEYDMALVLSALRISAQKSHRKLHSLLEPGGSTSAEEQQEKQKNDTERAGPSGGAGS